MASENALFNFPFEPDQEVFDILYPTHLPIERLPL